MAEGALVMTFAATVALVIMMLVLGISIGQISEKASTATGYTELAGMKAAGAFYISNSDGDLGEINKNKLKERIKNSAIGKKCGVDEPGFRKNERLEIGIGNFKCSRDVTESIESTVPFTGITAVVKVPVYTSDTGEYVNLFIGDAGF